METQLGCRPSYAWRSICNVRVVLEMGLGWRVVVKVFEYGVMLVSLTLTHVWCFLPTLQWTQMLELLPSWIMARVGGIMISFTGSLTQVMWLEFVVFLVSPLRQPDRIMWSEYNYSKICLISPIVLLGLCCIYNERDYKINSIRFRDCFEVELY
jgi:hypothetical protein